MRKSETEANIWWVALVTAVVSKAVDRSADVVFPPSAPPPTEQCECETISPSDAQRERNDKELAEAWLEMQERICEPARTLLESHLTPAPYRGGRRKPQFRLGLSAQQNDPAEQALYNLQSFVLLIGALIASGALSVKNTCRTLGQSVREWRAMLTSVAQLDRRMQLPFDLARLEELLRAIAVLAMLEDNAGRQSIQPLVLQRTSIEISDDGKFIACGQLYNPNGFRAPSAAICIDYADNERNVVGHLLVWPTTLAIGPHETLEFFNPLPIHPGFTPVGFRLARSRTDF
jgi:hypothetical protein